MHWNVALPGSANCDTSVLQVFDYLARVYTSLPSTMNVVAHWSQISLSSCMVKVSSLLYALLEKVIGIGCKFGVTGHHETNVDVVDHYSPPQWPMRTRTYSCLYCDSHRILLVKPLPKRASRARACGRCFWDQFVYQRCT